MQCRRVMSERHLEQVRPIRFTAAPPEEPEMPRTDQSVVSGSQSPIQQVGLHSSYACACCRPHAAASERTEHANMMLKVSENEKQQQEEPKNRLNVLR